MHNKTGSSLGMDDPERYRENGEKDNKKSVDDEGNNED